MSAARLWERRALFEVGGYSVPMLFCMTASGLSSISCSSVASFNYLQLAENDLQLIPCELYVYLSELRLTLQYSRGDFQ